MNYFFFTSSKDFCCRLTIPKFSNFGHQDHEMKLIRARIVDEQWQFCEHSGPSGDYFWEIESDSLSEDDIFFLATEEQLLTQQSSLCLLDLNTYTNTVPDYRCNLEIFNDTGGFSSYQSEYPYQMVTKKGAIYSPVASLSNPRATKNSVFFRNIYEYPVNEVFSGWLVNKRTGEVIRSFELCTNKTNYVSLEDIGEDPDLVFYAKGFLGVPIYVSADKSGQLSFEHTHPPHSNVFGRFDLVNKVKKSIDVIVER